MNRDQQIKILNEKAKGLRADEIVRLAGETFPGRITFATSLGEEDQVITDIIARVAPGISVFTLDTGRLHQETYELLAKTQKKYPQIHLQIYFPDTKAVEDMVKGKGINLFYESVENRKLCCGIRKVEPLRRALANVDAWMTGLRREQSVTRGSTEAFEWDEANQKIKVNPLHAQGFVSIGCAPCTRAIKPGEDIRAGRWWWEQPEQKECGLHNNPNRQQHLKDKNK